MLDTIRKYFLYAVLAFCLLASAIPPIPNGLMFYLLGLVIIGTFAIVYGRPSKEGIKFAVFLACCYLTSAINYTFDYRLFVFSGVLIFCTPIFDSNKIFEFRKKYLKISLHYIQLLGFVCLYCYIVGINVAEDNEELGELDFSAIFIHPMWLGAAIGISNIVSAWCIFNTKRKWLKLFWIISLLSSLLLSVISGSRSALTASALTILLLIYFQVRTFGAFVKTLSAIAVLVFIAFPFYYSKADRMIGKMENSEGEYGSRTSIYETTFEHIKDEPLIGCGFAACYVKNKKVIGRLETGSGWISILSQTGFIGLAAVLSIFYTLFKRIKNIREDKDLQFFVFPFIYLCLHSCLEGYILTSGYYLCILFWMLLSFLFTYSKHTNEAKVQITSKTT